jgi:hypothetical protein
MKMDKLAVGTKVYQAGFDQEGEPCTYEDEITGYRYFGDNKEYYHYLTKRGGFSTNSLGRNWYLEREEAFAQVKGRKLPPIDVDELKRINEMLASAKR